MAPIKSMSIENLRLWNVFPASKIVGTLYENIIYAVKRPVPKEGAKIIKIVRYTGDLRDL